MTFNPKANTLELNNQHTIQLLLSGDEGTFEQVYKHYLRRLHGYAMSILKDADIAEGMVQNVFMRLWERKERLSFSGSLQAYLYGAVYNECLNHLRHQKVKGEHRLHVSYTMTENDEATGAGMELLDLKDKLQLAMNELPEKCRTVFQMSRFEDLKYQEIADRLDLSIKTVEAHMGKALKLLRLRLADFLPLLLWLLHKLNNF